MRSSLESGEFRRVHRTHCVEDLPAGKQAGQPCREALFGVVSRISHIPVDVEVREERTVSGCVIDDGEGAVQRSYAFLERGAGRFDCLGDEGLGRGNGVVSGFCDRFGCCR